MWAMEPTEDTRVIRLGKLDDTECFQAMALASFKERVGVMVERVSQMPPGPEKEHLVKNVLLDDLIPRLRSSVALSANFLMLSTLNDDDF